MSRRQEWACSTSFSFFQSSSRNCQSCSRHLSCIEMTSLLTEYNRIFLPFRGGEILNRRFFAFWLTCSIYWEINPALIEEKPRQTTRELAHKMANAHVTVDLHSICKVQKQNARVPHVLTKKSKLQRFSTAVSLLARHEDNGRYKEPAWEFLPHLPFSPDVASSDYNIFQFF